MSFSLMKSLETVERSIGDEVVYENRPVQRSDGSQTERLVDSKLAKPTRVTRRDRRTASLAPAGRDEVG